MTLRGQCVLIQVPKVDVDATVAIQALVVINGKLNHGVVKVW